MVPNERHILSLVRTGMNMAALFIFVVGVIFHLAQMYLMALALVLLPIGVFFLGRMRSGKIRCVREFSSLCAVGERVPVSLLVENQGRWTQVSVRAADALPPSFLLHDETHALLLGLHAGSTREAAYSFEPTLRGRFSLGPTTIETQDPLGFYFFYQKISNSAQVAVYPQPVLLRQLFWDDTSGSGMQSRESRQRRGSGMDFQGVRSYQPGDELRHVHWRTTARTGALAVAEYASGTSLSTEIVLDLYCSAYAGTGQGKESALEYAVSIAASLCAFLIRRGDSVKLTLTSDSSQENFPEGPLSLSRILERLVDVTANAQYPLSASLQQSSRHPQEGNLVVITAQPEEAGLQNALLEESRRGRAVIGFALDAASFRSSNSLSLPPLTGQWRYIRRGDNIAQRVEE